MKTVADYQELFDKNIITNPYNINKKPIIVTSVCVNENYAILHVNDVTDGINNLNNIVYINNYGENSPYNSFSIDTEEYYQFMLNKYGERYLDDLLRHKGLDPDMIKSACQLPQNDEDK